MFGSLLTAIVLVVGPPAPARGEAKTDPVLENCEVAFIQNQAVPSSDAGVLVELKSRSGDFVKKDTVLARVDDREAKAARTVKELEFKVAKQKADSDITLKHAKAAALVDKAQYDKLELANKGSDRAVAAMEVMRAQFAWQKSELAIEKTKEEHDGEKLTADAKQAEVDAANVACDRRTLRAPFDGVVTDVFKHVGEWVSPGDQVVQLVRFERLTIDGSGRLDASVWSPLDVENRKATIEIALPGGRTVKIDGKVMFASPLVGAGQFLQVTVEADTPVENGRPVVFDGLRAKVTIHVSQPADRDSRPNGTRGKTAAAKS